MIVDVDILSLEQRCLNKEKGFDGGYYFYFFLFSYESWVFCFFIQLLWFVRDMFLNDVRKISNS